MYLVVLGLWVLTEGLILFYYASLFYNDTWVFLNSWNQILFGTFVDILELLLDTIENAYVFHSLEIIINKQKQSLQIEE